MTPFETPRRPLSAASIALIAAALIAAVAIAVALLRGGGGAPPAAPANSAQAEVASVDEMVAGLAQRLRQNPDDHEGWFLLGMAYRNSERFAEASQAFRRAMELQPRNADYTAYLGEMLILAGEGAPPPEAERLFRHALELEPGNAQARYYLATLRDLRGDHRGAVDDLLALLRTAPADAPWQPQVRDAVTSIAQRNHIDLAGRLPAAPAQPPQSTATAAIPGPTPEQMASASAIPPSQQSDMVRSMVERLAARLRANPRDAEGWIQLMRSRIVLNDPRAAGEALRSGLGAFSGDPATQARLRTAAAELGVPSA